MPQLEHITLSPIDHLVPRNYVKSALYLPLKPGVSYEQAFLELHQGLHRTFLQLPWLSGKVHWQSPDSPGWRPGQLEIRYTSPKIDGPLPYQLKYNELETDVTYDELKESGFPLDTFKDEELLWAEFLPPHNDGAEVFVGQINFIEGLCIISSAVHHSATDGMGSAMIPMVWADNCKNLHKVDLKTAAATVPLAPDCYDRSLMSRVIANEGNERPVHLIDPKTWDLLDLEVPSHHSGDDLEDDGKGGPRPAPARVMQASLFYVAANEWETLKRLSTDKEHAGLISGTDALYAFIWRCAMRARAAANPDAATVETLSHLELAIDIRPDFSAEGNIPPMYIGNCLLHNVIKQPVSNLSASLDEIALSATAGLIRDSVTRFSPQGIHDAYTLLSKATDFRRLRLRFTQPEGHDMMISSLLMFPTDQLIFGDSIFQNGGKVDSIRIMMGGFNEHFRMCFLLPKLSSGGVEFVINLYEDEMEKLLEDEEFERFASLC